ncbi:MAG: hypothetical protein AAGF10_07860 [Verrucomicrobiota bacterium]
MTHVPVWEERRSIFSHDWLKNIYLNRLDGFIARLSSEQPNRSRLSEFLQEDFPQWATHRQEAQWLLNSFDYEMSPLRLFAKLPLSRCSPETQAWLGPLTHNLWRTRYAVCLRLDKGRKVWREVEEAYCALAEQLDDLATIDVSRLFNLLPDFRKLREACVRLGKALSVLGETRLV